MRRNLETWKTVARLFFTLQSASILTIVGQWPLFIVSLHQFSSFKWNWSIVLGFSRSKHLIDIASLSILNSEIFGYDFLVNIWLISPEYYHRVLKYHEVFRSILKTYLSYIFNYLGPDCSVIPTCHNVSNCTGKGICVDFDICKCKQGWNGTNCTEYSCEHFDYCSGKFNLWFNSLRLFEFHRLIFLSSGLGIFQPFHPLFH